MKKRWVVALMALAGWAHAESVTEKKELVVKLLLLQQPAIELAAQVLAERPAVQLMQQVSMALQTRVAPDRREAVVKEIQADVKKYVDEAVPLVRERAVRIAPVTIGAMMDEHFSEDELRQLVAIIESPVNRKYLQMGSEMHKALMDRLVQDMQDTIEPKVKSLEQSVIKSLGMPVILLPKPSPKSAGK